MSGEGVQVLGPDGPALDLVDGEGGARALVWPGVASTTTLPSPHTSLSFTKGSTLLSPFFQLSNGA